MVKVDLVEVELYKNGARWYDYLAFRKDLEGSLKKNNVLVHSLVSTSGSILAGFISFLTLFTGIVTTLLSVAYDLDILLYSGAFFMIVGILFCFYCFALSFGFDFGFDFLLDKVRLFFGLASVGGIGGCNVGVFASQGWLRVRALRYIAYNLNDEVEVETFSKLCQGWVGSVDDAIKACKVLK